MKKLISTLLAATMLFTATGALAGFAEDAVCGNCSFADFPKFLNLVKNDPDKILSTPGINDIVLNNEESIDTFCKTSYSIMMLKHILKNPLSLACLSNFATSLKSFRTCLDISDFLSN